MTLLVRDEETMLHENLWYHREQGVDAFVVTDNDSSDRSREVVKTFAREHEVHLIDEPGRDMRQGEWVTRMARFAAQRLAPDWLIHNDADEFWMPHAGDLPAAFSMIPAAYGAAWARRVNMLPTVDESGWFIDRLVYRERKARNFLGRSLPGKTCHRPAPDVRVGEGSHRVTSGRLGPVLRPAPFTVYHYPFRALEQAREKVRTLGEARGRSHGTGSGASKVVRYLYGRLLDGTFDDFYRGISLAPERVRDATRDGTIIRDTTLRSFFSDRGYARSDVIR